MMKKRIFTILTMVLQTNFLTEQKKYERVRASIREKQKIVDDKLKENNLNSDDYILMMVAFKSDNELILYAKQNLDSTYKKLETFEICARSGTLGPKRKQGDLQVPEGFYFIDRFNPIFIVSVGIFCDNSDRPGISIPSFTIWSGEGILVDLSTSRRSTSMSSHYAQKKFL